MLGSTFGAMCWIHRRFDSVRNPSNKSLWKVHVALSCSHQQFHGSLLLSVDQIDREGGDLNAIFESMITGSKVGVLSELNSEKHFSIVYLRNRSSWPSFHFSPQESPSFSALGRGTGGRRA